jgi:hypothetical protein
MTTRIVASMSRIRTPEPDATSATSLRQPGEAVAAPSNEPTEVLFREAKRRERKRRLSVLAALLAAAGLGVGLVVTSGGAPPSRPHVASGSDDGRPTSLQRGSARVTTVELTRSDKYSEITTVGNRILLYGSTSQSTDLRITDTCFSAFVDPSSLELSNERSGSCANPALQGQRVLPVFAIDKNLPAGSGGPSAVVRIARVVAKSPGYALGPVVMTFAALAWGDSAPTWIYGGGDLWLYEWDNPGGIDLMRISAATGAVLQRMRVPKVWKPILAYNDDGLWIAPSGQSGGPPNVLYRVTPGDTKAAAVFHFAGEGFAKWIVGSGDDLWVNAQPRAVSDAGVLWMLRGPQAKPVWHVPESASLVQVFEILGDSGVVGDAADGLWAAAPTSYDEQQVVRINPASGASSIEAAWKTGYPGSAKYLYLSPLTSWNGVSLAGSFFLLDPPLQSQTGAATIGSFSALYRITPAG